LKLVKEEDGWVLDILVDEVEECDQISVGKSQSISKDDHEVHLVQNESSL
jgi:hypothetical protein